MHARPTRAARALPVRCPCGVVQRAGGGAEDSEDWVVAPDGCDAVVPRGELAAHTASCPFEPVGCAQVGHGRIVALYCRSSTSYHIR